MQGRRKLYLLPLIAIWCAATFVSLCSSAQAPATFTSGKWGLGVDYLGGKIMKHSKKIDHVPGEASHGFQIDYYMKTLGGKPWHKPLNFPEVGGTLLFLHFGENAVFGDAIALMGYGKFFVYRSRWVNAYVRVGAGYAYLTKKYDYQTNPTNNLISTNIDLSVQLKIGLDWKLDKYVQLSTAFSFNHFSNSAVNLPNYGANLFMGALGVKVIPQPKDMSYNCERKKDFKKNEVFWEYTLGIQEVYGYNGPKYPIHTGTVAYARYTSPGNKIYGGLSFEYLRSVHDWIAYNEIPTRHGPVWEASIGSVIIGDELLLGHIGMFYSMGAYLWKNQAALSPVYFKIGANVYFVQFGKRKGIKFFVGNNVKAHSSVAQANEFSIGGAF